MSFDDPRYQWLHRRGAIDVEITQRYISFYYGGLPYKVTSMEYKGTWKSAASIFDIFSSIPIGDCPKYIDRDERTPYEYPVWMMSHEDVRKLFVWNFAAFAKMILRGSTLDEQLS